MRLRSDAPRSERSLRALCRRELKGLKLDLPLDASQLCARYGERRGRPINVIAHPLPAGTPNGVWLAADDGDYFFYQANTTAAHRDQIIIHEFGHLIAGHQVLGQSALAAMAQPAKSSGQSPSSEQTQDALVRTCYSDAREWEAEMLATLIVEWATKAERGVGELAEDDGLRGIQQVLGGHNGWL